jgi:sucrose-6-phosphate hydrolase SacC (GH32 family)
VDQHATSGWGTTSAPAMVAVYTAHPTNDINEDVRISVSTDCANFLYWTQRSEFGPMGGRQEIWEVPGLVQLPVRDLDLKKWVLFCGLDSNIMKWKGWDVRP